MLTGQSLLVQGMASRLLSQPDKFEVFVLHADGGDCRPSLREAKPNVIVMDTSDPDIRGFCLLADMIWEMPEATFLLMNSESSHLQVISSQRFPISDSQALLDEMMAPTIRQ